MHNESYGRTKRSFSATDSNKEERRGVAPIIATLLMVAVAVVGGILIFVFAQGFFGTTSDLSVGGTSLLSVTGYDARDATALKYHDGVSTGTINPAADGQLSEGDAVLVYVKNEGTKDVTISSIEINDVSHNTFDDSAVYSATVPVNGTFAVDTASGTANGDADAVLAGGETGTIIVRYDGSAIPNGRNTTIKVITADGGEFSIAAHITDRET
jgi:flagellin-like protein